MARRKQDTADKTGAAGPRFDPQKVGAYVRRVENVLDEIASERGSYMAACKALRDDISDILGEAKEAGIPKKELKAAIEARGLQKKIDKLADRFDSDGRETYDQIRIALGDLADTPLGQAAARGAAGATVKPADDAPSPADILAHGIKPLKDGEGASTAA